MRETVENIIRVGIVSSIDPAEGTARVAFPDRAGLVAAPCQQIIPFSSRNNASMPIDVGEQVLCVFLPNGQQTGFIIGTMSSKKHPAPEDAAEGVFILQFEDGMTFRYDRNDSTTKITFADGAELNHDGKGHDFDFRLFGDSRIKYDFSEDAGNRVLHIVSTGCSEYKTEANAHTNVTENADIFVGDCMTEEIGGSRDAMVGGDVVFTAGGAITLTAGGDVHINGNLFVNGNISATGDIVAGGISLMYHTHGGVMPGGDSTGEPQ